MIAVCMSSWAMFASAFAGGVLGVVAYETIFWAMGRRSNG